MRESLVFVDVLFTTETFQFHVGHRSENFKAVRTASTGFGNIMVNVESFYGALLVIYLYQKKRCDMPTSCVLTD